MDSLRGGTSYARAGRRGVGRSIAVLLPLILVSGLSLATCPHKNREVTTLVYKGVWSDYEITFSPEVIPASVIRKIVWLSPFMGDDVMGPFNLGQANVGGQLDKSILGPGLEDCMGTDPAYAPCGTRDLRSPNFFINAETNLKKGQQELDALNPAAYPPEISPVVNYLRCRLEFYHWLDQTRLKFYRTWDVHVLERKYRGVDLSNLCAPVIDEIGKGASREKKYRLAMDWVNCVLNGWPSKAGLGTYPMDTWERFTREYGIKESYHENLGD